MKNTAIPDPARPPLRILVAPDSFKGSLSATQAAAAIKAGLQHARPEATVRCLPIADGGEGTLDALLHAQSGQRRTAMVSDAAGRPIEVDYGLLPDGSAVIEVARIVGFTQPGIAAMPLADRTTAGVGQLLRTLLDQGVRRFMIGLGGSCTNDGGIGMLQALGLRLVEHDGRIVALDGSGLDPRLTQSHMELLTDVDNPLCGEQGATRVFGPQKGALSQDLLMLEARLWQFSRLADAALVDAPGAGAAGGLGYALQWLGGEYFVGAEQVLDLLGFDDALATADWVITGEGRSDAQTLHGKGPWIVARRAHAAGVPAALLVGSLDAGTGEQLASLFALRLALTELFPLDQSLRDPATCLEHAAYLLCARMQQ